MGATLHKRAALPSIKLDPCLLDDPTPLPFDVYGPSEDACGFALCCEAGQRMPAASADAGRDALYAKGEDLAQCLDYVEDRLPRIVAAGRLPVASEAEWVYVLAGRALEAVFGRPTDPVCYSRAKRAARALADSVARRSDVAGRMLARAAEAYSLRAHSVNVAVRLTDFACRVLAATGRDQLLEVALGGLLHDLGKTQIPREVLLKSGPLPDADAARLREHPRRGLVIAMPHVRGMAVTQRIVREHHEDYAGTGYPDGRTGEATSRFARAARIVDAYDALTSRRSYAPAAGAYEALSVMASEMRGCFDPDLLRAFIRYLADGRATGLVQTGTGGPSLQTSGDGPPAPGAGRSLFNGPPIDAGDGESAVADGGRIVRLYVGRGAESGTADTDARLAQPATAGEDGPMDMRDEPGSMSAASGPAGPHGLAPNDPGTIDLHARILRTGTRPAFDVYRRSDDGTALVLCHAAGQTVSDEVRRDLDRLGVDVLWVCRQDGDACLDYVEENLSAILREAKLPSRREAGWVYAVTCRAVAALLDRPTAAASYERVARAVGALVTCIRRSPGAAWTMATGRSRPYDTAVHSVNVCALLTEAARQILDVTAQDRLGLVALGGVLHDLGKTAVPQEVLRKPGALTAEEFAHICEHPAAGVRIARPYIRGLPEVEEIISQHHEDASGTGYPGGLAGDEINEMARMARIVDTFDALRNRQRHGRLIDSRTALCIMAEEMPGRFDAWLLAEFARHAGRALGPGRTDAVGAGAATVDGVREFVKASRRTLDVVYRYALRRAGDDEAVPQRSRPEKSDGERRVG